MSFVVEAIARRWSAFLPYRMSPVDASITIAAFACSAGALDGDWAPTGAAVNTAARHASSSAANAARGRLTARSSASGRVAAC